MNYFINQPSAAPAITRRPARYSFPLRRALRRIVLLGVISAGALLTALPVQAAPVSHPAGWGLGVMLGSPTGLTVKRWLGGANAWDVGVGIGGFGFNPGFRLHADYLWGIAQVLPDTTDVTLDIYLGVGPVVGVAQNRWSCRSSYDRRYYNDCGSSWVYAGARIPLGVELRLQRAPLAFAIEIAPGVVAGQNYVSGLFDGTLIARYLF